MSAIVTVLVGLFAVYVLVEYTNAYAYRRYGRAPLSGANLTPASLLPGFGLFGLSRISDANLRDQALQSLVWSAAYGFSFLVAAWRFVVNLRQTNALIGALAAAGHVVYGLVFCLLFVGAGDIYRRHGLTGLALAVLGGLFVLGLLRGRVYHVTTRYPDGSVARSEIRTRD